MPCDSSYDVDNLFDYQSVLSEIDSLNHAHDEIDYVVVAGDFNTDISRPHSLHTPTLIEFCESPRTARW